MFIWKVVDEKQMIDEDISSQSDGLKDIDRCLLLFWFFVEMKTISSVMISSLFIYSPAWKLI